jgi:hypothetical protein
LNKVLGQVLGNPGA